MVGRSEYVKTRIPSVLLVISSGIYDAFQVAKLVMDKCAPLNARGERAQTTPGVYIRYDRRKQSIA